MKKVTVLLASFNGEKYLIDQLDSLTSQVKVNLSILCRDDASSDNSFELLQKFSEAHENITVIRNEYPSGGAAKNFYKLFNDSQYLDSEYFAFCDQDDIWSQEKLFKAINAIEISGAVGYSCSVRAFFVNQPDSLLFQSSKVRKFDFLFEGAGQGCTFVIRCDFFKKLIRFVNSNQSMISNFYYHDWLVYLVARSYGYSWYFDPTPYVLYRQHINNDTGARVTFRSYKARFSLIKNGWYSEQLNIAISIANLLPISNDKDFLFYIRLFRSKKSLFVRKFTLALFVIKYGRRRLIDRVVIVFSIFMSYI